ncbi:two pore domain potassium channel family protein [Rhodococcus hoagii]|uniref:potassium channel family protein n=1 Tax=Rhodococcus hoagii TaxID=43767 RepID=UPI0007CD8178|nr:potassium channel family protein [Prescottella equi]MBM4533338.1 two pore domain potassium channel family protein [Prescottella equi]NKR84048.1 two pore domain potassium channel family protein [Prescottella equi]ORJ98202.1 ion channel family protein [Prescottella equi]ORL07781.1 ion channel family protein [Prescottella equi]ORL80124.1 ion channel family protein [Prescottella equi]
MSDAIHLVSLDRHDRRRMLRRALLRSAATVVILLTAYFALPMDHVSDAGAILVLTGGASMVVALCAWQVRQIIHSPTPEVRSAEALAVTLPVYLLGSATAIVLLSQMDPAAFNETLTRIDALYFTLTVFATVGFGDIAAVTQPARAVVTVMIVGNLVMLAVGVKLLTQAVKWGRALQDTQEAGGGEVPPPASGDNSS